MDCGSRCQLERLTVIPAGGASTAGCGWESGSRLPQSKGVAQKCCYRSSSIVDNFGYHFAERVQILPCMPMPEVNGDGVEGALIIPTCCS
jgi:hypothetical protein